MSIYNALNNYKLYNIIVLLLLFSINVSISIKETVKEVKPIDTFSTKGLTKFISLRQKHLKNISSIDKFLTNFAMTKMRDDALVDVKTQIKKIFKQVGESVNEVNNNFNENYNVCLNKLNKFSQECDISTDEINDQIEGNTAYANSFQMLNPRYESLINKLVDYNIFSIASDIVGGDNDITEKNDIINVYTEIARNLDSQFKIVKSDEMRQVLLEFSQIPNKESGNSFLEETVKKFDLMDNQDYMLQRRHQAQMLFNKVSSYLNSSIERKTKLLMQRENLFQNMKKNDETVKSLIEDTKNKRRDNSELSYSLIKDNEILLNKIKTCDDMKNTNLECEENGRLYKSIIHSYERITGSLHNLFKVINPNKSE